ncbi:hypothetical protein [Terrimonas alba]|uniref:hypothetical protein n=1 Tax=Terrimonas alba TaxID=3349636 RepID=UPI0035F4C538
MGWHRASTPWDYFPRHLSTTEFKDPYKPLRKFTRYRPLNKWREILKELCHHALSPTSIHEFDDGTSMIRTWLHLHKLLEATHLIEVRTIGDEEQPRKKWKQGWQAEKLADADTKENKLAAEVENDKPSLVELAREHIKEFFLFFGEDGAREELWAMLKRSLSNEDDQTLTTDRSKMIFLYEQLTELVGDIYILHMQQESKQND